MRKYWFWIGVLLAQMVVLWAEEPESLYLTWLHDPTTTMTIQWHSSEGEADVYYQKAGDGGWVKEEGTVGFSKGDLVVHSIELQGLESGSDYVFQIGKEGKEYRFRTMPKTTERPVRFVVAGDAYFHLYLLRKMNIQIAKTDPDFVVVGGDIAYTNGHVTLFKGKDWEIRRWGTFLNEWKKLMVTSDGRLIPMVVVVGNHDLKRSYVQEEKNAGLEVKEEKPVLFYELFAMPEKGVAYRVLDFSNYLSLILLDTGHSYSIKGQCAWLEETLASREHVVNKMAAYHVAAYPSVYRYDSSIASKIRAYWVPILERFKVRTVFEHHNHAYKRTHRIKEGKVDPDGVVYLGDGAWGVSARKPISAKKTWYLAQSAQKNCFWQVTILNDQCYIKSYDITGKVIEDLEEAL
jgi:acid phosphatase type 7